MLLTIVRAWNVVRANINLFRLLYWSVAIATFRHSAIGFATLEAGNVLLGALAATAVDVGMMLAAEHVRRVHNWRTGQPWWLVGGLVLAALASIYSQLLYAVTNASAVQIAPGALWMQEAAQLIVDARVVVLPVLLPLLAVVYSFASRTAAEAAVDQVVHEHPSTYTERARVVLSVVPDASNVQLAEILGCSPSAVSRARNGAGGGHVLGKGS